MKSKIVVFSGAGMSAESGIMTFRDMGGLWERYDVTDVASPVAWENNPQLVMNFYNQRRKQLLQCQPNKGHLLIAALQDEYDVQVITQNVDDLHERAGSIRVLHLHGELKKARSTGDEALVYPIEGWEMKMGDCCAKGFQLRPHIVWFGEAVPMMEEAIALVQQADVFVVVGTSLQVYPAASLLQYVPKNVPVFVIDPGTPAFTPDEKITFIQKKASEGVMEFIDHLKILINSRRINQ